jgi:hypothetical protein
MRRMLARTGRLVAAIVAGAILTGCHFAVVPPKSHPKASASPSVRDPYAARLADAPALLTQCAVDHAGLRPGAGQDWFSHGQVSVNTTNATNFAIWWGSHDQPGPYPQTFVIAGHQTHYLVFGTAWVNNNGRWVPTYAANRTAPQYSLAAWVNWAAVNDKLPPLVCGTALTASQLQAQIFGNATPSPW